MLRKIISFIFPLTRKIKSDYSGYLELTQINGKTLLDTANTNYSYGSLQRILHFSLLQIDLSKIKNILVLGLGGGSVLKTIRNIFHFTGNITAVDIDPVIIQIADKEFGIASNDSTKIICSDAFDYVKNNNSKFDLIIIDLFIDNVVPEKFLSLEFWSEIINRTEADGYIIFNTLCSSYTDIQQIENILNEKGLECKLFRYVEKSNNVLIANYRKQHLHEFDGSEVK